MAPAYPEDPASGTWSVTAAPGSSCPDPARIPVTQPTTDFDTDMSRCGVAAVMPSP